MADFVDSLQIIGNTSGGGLVNVEDGYLMIRPTSRLQDAVARGDAYCWACVTQDFDAADTMIGLQNDETTRSLYIEKILVGSATTTQAIVFGASGVTVAGDNTIAGVNLNRNYSRLPNTSCADDETGNAEAATSWTKKIAGLRILAGQTAELDFGGKLVLGPGQFVGVDAVSDITAGNVTIWGWFE